MQEIRLAMRQHSKSTALLIAAQLAIGGVVLARNASAETLKTSSSGVSSEAVWTTCPARPSVTVNCNYTAVYAARANTFQPFVTISLANLRVYPSGYVEVLASATGYMQPATTMTVATSSTLASATAAGGVYLYGDCGNPNDLRTCYYYGIASLSARWSATAGKTSWPESRKITDPSGIAYQLSTTGASRPAYATGAATYNGSAWALGLPTSGRILAFGRTETLTCPSTCPRTASARMVSGPQPPPVPTGDPAGMALGVRDLLAPMKNLGPGSK